MNNWGLMCFIQTALSKFPARTKRPFHFQIAFHEHSISKTWSTQLLCIDEQLLAIKNICAASWKSIGSKIFLYSLIQANHFKWKVIPSQMIAHIDSIRFISAFAISWTLRKNVQAFSSHDNKCSPTRESNAIHHINERAKKL